MATTNTPGITIDKNGSLVLDKEYRGLRLFRRLGRITQAQAEHVLQNEVARLREEIDRRAHARPLQRTTDPHRCDRLGVPDLRRTRMSPSAFDSQLITLHLVTTLILPIGNNDSKFNASLSSRWKLAGNE